MTKRKDRPVTLDVQIEQALARYGTATTVMRLLDVDYAAVKAVRDAQAACLTADTETPRGRKDTAA